MIFNKNKKYNKLIEEALSYFNEGNYKDALNKYEEAFKIKTILKDYIMYGCILIDINELPKAETIFKQLKEQFDFYEIYYSLGVIYEKTNRKYDALEQYKKVIELDPNFEQAHFAIAYLHDEIAEENNEELDGKNTKIAIKHYNEVLNIDENNYWCNINLGSIYERNDENNKALEYFLKSYNIDNNKIMVNYNLGVVYYKLKQYDQSLKYYLQELKQEKPFVSTYYNLGILYKDGFKDYEKAKYYYLKALEQNKEDYNVWYNLGCVHCLNNDLEEGYECFKYIYYKNKKYLNYLDTDPELEEFRKTDYFKQIKSGF